MKIRIKTAGIGLVTGFANGLFGSGGGSIVVPAMEKYLGIETKKAHATALAVILPLSALSAALYFIDTAPDWYSILYVSLGGVVGGIIGAKLLKRLAADWIRRIFGLALAAAGVRMLFY